LADQRVNNFWVEDMPCRHIQMAVQDLYNIGVYEHIYQCFTIDRILCIPVEICFELFEIGADLGAVCLGQEESIEGLIIPGLTDTSAQGSLGSSEVLSELPESSSEKSQEETADSEEPGA